MSTKRIIVPKDFILIFIIFRFSYRALFYTKFKYVNSVIYFDMSSNNENEKKVITVRGVEKDLYERIIQVARDSGRTVGEVINDAIRTFLAFSERIQGKIDETTQKAIGIGKAFVEGYNEAGRNILIISDLEELRVNKNEIVSAGKPISFRNIKKLILEDIDQDTINNYIDSIISVDELVVPSSVNKLLLLPKCKFVKKITAM